MNQLFAPFQHVGALRLRDLLDAEQNSFGVIRLAMAIAVLVSHSYFFVSGVSATEPLVAITGHSLGEHAVQVFFLLSGLLVTESLMRSRSITSFYCGRVLRVFPGLIVCVALVAFVLGPLVSDLGFAQYFANPQWLTYLVKTLLLVTGAAQLPGVFSDLPAAGSVNMSLWTLKYEMICYVGLGLLGAAGILSTRLRPLAAAGLALILAVIWLKAPDPDRSTGLIEHVRYFSLYFGVGALGALLKDYIVVNRWLTLPLLAMFAAAIGTGAQELACALFLGYATLVVATFRFGPLRAWCNANDISYGVYIYAAPIQQALLMFYPGVHPLALSAVALALTVIPASLSWTFVEKPAMALRPKATAIADRLMAWPRYASISLRLQADRQQAARFQAYRDRMEP